MPMQPVNSDKRIADNRLPEQYEITIEDNVGNWPTFRERIETAILRTPQYRYFAAHDSCQRTYNSLKGITAAEYIIRHAH